MAKPKRKTTDTWKTKRWYKIVAPAIFGEKEIGVTPASSPEKILGRVIDINLYSLTGKRELQHVKAKLKVTEMNGETGITAPIGHELQRSYIGRITKRAHTIVTSILPVATKDGKKVKITGIIVSRRGSDEKHKREMRRIMSDKIRETAANSDLNNLFQQIVYGKLAGSIFTDVKKVFPVNRVEIVKSNVLE